MFKRCCVCILLLAAAAGKPESLTAQPSRERATLAGWEQRIRNFMLDRSHNYGGTHYNRGLFREHMITMSPEHDLDLLTYRYTLIEDYRWLRSDRIYRLSVGSLNATDFAMENRLKSRVALNERNRLTVSGYQEENLRAGRLLFYLGYEHSFDSTHAVGIEHSLTGEKSDLDATLYYRFGSIDRGMVRVAMTAMDWGSNVVQGLAKEGYDRYQPLYRTTHHYQAFPFLLSVNLFSAKTGDLAAEVVAGMQTRSQKRVEPAGDSTDYIDREWAHYLGAMIEYTRPGITAGMTYRRTFSKLKRRPAPGSVFENRFGNWQFSDIGGAFAVARIRRFRLEQWLWYEASTDRLQGEHVPQNLNPYRSTDRQIPFDYRERRIMVKSRVLYEWFGTGFSTGLEFHADYRYPQGKPNEDGIRNREFRNIYPIIRKRNERLTLTAGYRFSDEFYLEAGVSYDIDKDREFGGGRPRQSGTMKGFDGGFGRLTLRW